MGFPRTECDRLNYLIPYSQVWIAATGVFQAAPLAPEIHPLLSQARLLARLRISGRGSRLYIPEVASRYASSFKLNGSSFLIIYVF